MGKVLGSRKAGIPRAASVGEETLAFHLAAYRIPFQREVCLVTGRKWRWDFVVGDLAIEVQGGTWIQGGHSRGQGQERDCEKQNAAVKAGFRPLSYTTEMVTAGTAIDDVRALLPVIL